MIIIFMQKFWSVNSTLGQERHVYACAEGSVTKFFYVKMFLRKFCSLGQSFMQNHQGVLELFKRLRLNSILNSCVFAFSGTEKCFKIKFAVFLLLLLVDVVCKVSKTEPGEGCNMFEHR